MNDEETINQLIKILKEMDLQRGEEPICMNEQTIAGEDSYCLLTNKRVDIEECSRCSLFVEYTPSATLANTIPAETPVEIPEISDEEMIRNTITENPEFLEIN